MWSHFNVVYGHFPLDNSPLGYRTFPPIEIRLGLATLGLGLALARVRVEVNEIVMMLTSCYCSFLVTITSDFNLFQLDRLLIYLYS